MDAKAAVQATRGADGQVVRALGPGLVDLQVNGYGGLSFNGEIADITLQALLGACRMMQRRGVTEFLATVTTSAPENMVARLARLAELRRQDPLAEAMLAGFHVEGPFISPDDGPRGAHARQFVIAPANHRDLYDRLVQAGGGMLRLLSLAPEIPGAMDLISRAAGDGVTVALAHHAADPQTLDRAVKAGARMCTHLGNGSAAMLPRLDNYIQHQLADDRLAASFIADGHHIPFPTLRNFLRAKQVHRSVLVTDAILAADMPPGRYASGSRVRVLGPDGAVRLPGTPYLAGSAITMDKCVLNVAHHCDVSFEDAWRMGSVQPAELVGLPAPPTVEVDVTESGFVLRT